MRTAGALVVLICSYLLGQRAAAGRQRRAAELEALISALHLLETEIVVGKRLLAEALTGAGAAHPECRLLFEKAAQEVAAGRSARRAWEEGVRSWQEVAALRQEDLEPLLRLGAVLGLSTGEDQARHLELARRELSHRLEAQRVRLGELIRLYRLLGVFGGVALVLLLY